MTMEELLTKIVVPTPTEAELREVAEKWMKPLRPCLYTYWPAPLKRLSFPTITVTLESDELSQLIAAIDHFDAEWQPALIERISYALSQHNNGSFFRLESRSPKDNYWGEATRYRACFWHDVKKLIYSERVLDDLVRYRNQDEPVRLLFREWHPIQHHEEFRCFIKARRLVGITQYHYSSYDEATNSEIAPVFANIAKRAKSIPSLIAAFIAEQLIPHLHIDDIVADVWLDHLDKIILIELNPYGLSDPCLLTYDDLAITTDCLFRCNLPNREKQPSSSLYTD